MTQTKQQHVISFKETLKEIEHMSAVNNLEEALYRILNCGRLDVAKEIAADALGEDVDEFLESEDLDALEFDSSSDDNEYPEEMNFYAKDDEYPI